MSHSENAVPSKQPTGRVAQRSVADLRQLVAHRVPAAFSTAERRLPSPRFELDSIRRF